MDNQKVLIIGGVAGGATAAARLRRLDEHCEIIMLERGEYISFANCGLPYYISGTINDKSALTLQTPQSFNARFNVDVRIFSEVTAIDTANKCVTIKNLTNDECYTETYDKLIISTGADPIVPNISGALSDKVLTLRNIPDTYKIKERIDKGVHSVAIMGGGYIGMEMAENLHARGISVTVIELAEQVIAPLDFDVAVEVHNYVKSKGIQLILGNGVKEIVDLGNSLDITLNNGSVKSDILIMAIGVKPSTAIAISAGLTVNSRGYIITDNSMRTSDPNIYAVGDAIEVSDFVTGKRVAIPLAGPANKQGRIAADCICGLDSKYNGTQGSAILKVFDMTIASTGINEKTAKRLNLNYDKSFTYSASHASYYPNASNIAIKTIFEKDTGKILGAQLVGFEGVDKRCDVFATAIRANLTAFDLTHLELCYAPPFSSAKDPVNMAGYVIENLLTNKVKNFHWHDVAALQRMDKITLLDTRTEYEFKRGHIAGFINIPLDELRDRLDELDTNKPVYVTCQVGLRGYVSARILLQNGFDTYNLSGGFRLYNAIFNIV